MKTEGRNSAIINAHQICCFFMERIRRMHTIKRIGKRICDAGGCDATDDYGQGYDDAITLALNILLEETGYTIEEILDYEEDDRTYETGKEKAAERKTGEGSWNKKEVAVSVFVKLTAAEKP